MMQLPTFGERLPPLYTVVHITECLTHVVLAEAGDLQRQRAFTFEKGEKYIPVPETFGIDKDGIFEKSPIAMSQWLETRVSRPFIPLFKLGERQMYQCEFDQYCSEKAEEAGFEFYKEECKGNIYVWKNM
jgi:hypothetical protein